jgi:hypothetical protein
MILPCVCSYMVCVCVSTYFNSECQNGTTMVPNHRGPDRLIPPVMVVMAFQQMTSSHCGAQLKRRRKGKNG